MNNTVFALLLSILCPLSVYANDLSCGDTRSKTWPMESAASENFFGEAEWNFKSLQDVSAQEIYATKLYQRLSGVTLPLSHPRFRKVVSLVKQGKRFEAAQIIAADPNFLRIRIRNFAAPFSNKDFSPFEPLNDLQALIIGVTRDELDARLLLTGNLRYSGYSYLGLPAVSMANNDHYTAFEQGNFDFNTDLERVNDQWSEMDMAAGALTTRAWAKAYYDAGTNRRSVKYAMDTFLCAPIESWKMRGVPDYFVRRDVDRAPGGDPATYQNHCRGCHAIMDGMGGAFARFEYLDGSLVYFKDRVAEKMNKNEAFYPAGFVTTDDTWTNLLDYNPTIDFGWRTPMEGKGVAEYGKALANSEAFGRCMVTKVFSEVCGKSIKDEYSSLLDPLRKDFEDHGYNLKHLFTKVATQPECINH